MEPIFIPQLAKAPEQTETIEVNEYLPDLETLTPVQGYLRVSHRGNYLEVSARAEAIVNLVCDRCLQHYNHRLSVDASELIWLQEPVDAADLPVEREISLEELIETLPPQGFFHPAAWLYEQLCLEIPHRKLCDNLCEGIAVKEVSRDSVSLGDRRWASLEALKNQLSN